MILPPYNFLKKMGIATTNQIVVTIPIYLLNIILNKLEITDKFLKSENKILDGLVRNFNFFLSTIARFNISNSLLCFFTLKSIPTFF